MAFYFRLDHRARLLAVFSPKCASSTLGDWLRALERHGDAQNAEQPVQQPVQQPGQPFYANPRQADGYRDYFKVLFLRDPLRRLVSFYAHWVVRQPGVWSFADHERRFRLDRKSFRRFLYALDHLHRGHLRFQHHLEPQMENTSGIDFDLVVLVEQLRPGLLALNRQLGFDYMPPHATRTPYDLSNAQTVADRSPQWLRRHAVPETRWFYDRELLEVGEHLYAEDISSYRRHGGETVSADPTAFY